MKHSLLLVAVACTLNASAQKVSNKLTFKKGQKLEMVSQVSSVSSADMQGMTMETKINATITRSFDVVDVNNGAATIEHKMKRMQMSFDVPMQGTQTFDSDNEADMKGESGKIAEKGMKNKYTMTVDHTGKITAIKADDDNPNQAADSTDSSDLMSSPFSQMIEGMDLPKPGDMSPFRILPDKEVCKGQSWTDSAANRKTVYTISDITGTDIIINYTEDAKTMAKQEANGMEVAMTSKDTTTGKITLDKKTGLLRERTSTTTSDGNMEVMGMSVPMNTKITKTVAVKSL